MNRSNVKFAQFPIDMFYSEAYHKLNKNAILLLQYVQFQFRIVKDKSNKKNYIITNQDNITLPYSLFKKSPFNFANSSMTKAIDLLLWYGFLTIKEQGGREKGHATIYGYVEKWKTWKNGDGKCEERKPYRKTGFTKK